LRLRAVSGPHIGHVVDVVEPLTIGRGWGCELVLDDPTVSRRHATLLRAGGGLVVCDDGSLNGTWLNDRRISSPVSLAAGDRVRIGSSEFVVRDDGGDPAEHAKLEDVEPAELPEPARRERTLVAGGVSS
jgi:pSer/pThr/pTyr-binding forkhead associated (FHA) protein